MGTSAGLRSRGALFVVACCCLLSLVCGGGKPKTTSAVGDPGMKRDGLRVALEAWNFCNEVGEEAPGMGSPRLADCFDIVNKTEVVHMVADKDNRLGFGDDLPGSPPKSLENVDLYAVQKELYLGKKCEVADDKTPWQFWMIMLKNGNLDTSAGLCPKDGNKVGPFPPDSRFPCFGTGCMNQPLVFHDSTILKGTKLSGRFYGTYDLDGDISEEVDTASYFSVSWEKELGKGGWSFHHVLKTTKSYPWLMLYLRSDATRGFSGGYHYETRGMTKIIPESPNFKVRLTLDIKRGGGSASQFYLMDMGSCWKNNGDPCDGDVTSDVTRYSEMILNPQTEAWCRPDNLHECPPYHTLPNGTRIHRTDTANFPYGAYHVYCSPGNALKPENPYRSCDPYSNPQPQEILQILPHAAWAEYGYPTKPGEGWVGDPRTWELDVGRLSQSLYFYQDPNTTAAKRKWTSLDVGTEIYKSDDDVAEWILSDFDIIVPQSGKVTVS
ncbi:hypothetical protein C4D60_Mb06t14090 [Musa balbisiana]|uniref:DUF7705 domain-containing protein n=1 Tax=Musa balbisiana TaxID=52838 RepID=A0A4S8IMV4_MUSBA|nr:hypothetical protein C4D60_Mb06t14090 [Musa balbisiana]